VEGWRYCPGALLNSKTENSYSISLPTIKYKKWKIKNLQEIADCNSNTNKHQIKFHKNKKKLTVHTFSDVAVGTCKKTIPHTVKHGRKTLYI